MTCCSHLHGRFKRTCRTTVAHLFLEGVDATCSGGLAQALMRMQDDQIRTSENEIKKTEPDKDWQWTHPFFFASKLQMNCGQIFPLDYSMNGFGSSNLSPPPKLLGGWLVVALGRYCTFASIGLDRLDHVWSTHCVMVWFMGGNACLRFDTLHWLTWYCAVLPSPRNRTI